MNWRRSVMFMPLSLMAENVVEKKLSRVAVTIGDAAGVGPEIVVKSIADLASSGDRLMLVGDAGAILDTATACGVRLPDYVVVSPTQAGFDGHDGKVVICDLANLKPGFAVGGDAAETGRAAAENIVAAVDLWKRGVIDAIATAPISKAAIKLGGYDFPGHTEFLAHLTDTPEFAMSFFAEKLRVVLLSTHLSLRDALGLVTTDRLVELAKFTDRTLSLLLGRRPRIAFAGVNPHASEGGLFGNEEAREIIPAVEECYRAGLDASGPFSPDTIFLRGFKGEFDVVIACYHDQATIAVKCLSFGASVNVTLGLPLIRTSVDHGTAYDIAGRNRAEFSSMSAAISLAGELARMRRENS